MPATITLKAIPDDIYTRLKASAEANRRSLNSEILVCLESRLMPARLPAADQLAAIRALRDRLPAAKFQHEDIDVLKRGGRA